MSYSEFDEEIKRKKEAKREARAKELLQLSEKELAVEMILQLEELRADVARICRRL